jgi:hypothetical protein
VIFHRTLGVAAMILLVIAIPDVARAQVSDPTIELVIGAGRPLHASNPQDEIFVLNFADKPKPGSRVWMR